MFAFQDRFSNQKIHIYTSLHLQDLFLASWRDVLLLQPVMRATEVRCTMMMAERELKRSQGKLQAKRKKQT